MRPGARPRSTRQSRRETPPPLASHPARATQAVRTPLPFVERLIIALLFGTTLTMAIANNPGWGRLFDLSLLLPARYVDLMSVLPVETNTALVFVALNLITLTILFVARDPVLPLGIVTALSLGLATYPYGRIRWHRLIAEFGTTAEAPGPAQWITVGIPVLLLTALPLMLHIRRLRSRYLEKHVDAADTRRLTQHLARSAVVTGAIAIGISLLIGSMLRLGTVIARQTDLLRDNALVVIAVVALLLVLALAHGAGIFSGPPEDTESAAHVTASEHHETPQDSDRL